VGLWYSGGSHKGIRTCGLVLSDKRVKPLVRGYGNGKGNDNGSDIGISSKEDVLKSCFSFDEFWDMYNKKVDSKKCKEKYEKLTESQRAKIKQTLPSYLATIKDKQFQKHPSTYLNNECWNDEICFSSINSEKPKMCIMTSTQSGYGKEIEKPYSFYEKELKDWGSDRVKLIKIL
jgi:hypothetical protein